MLVGQEIWPNTLITVLYCTVHTGGGGTELLVTLIRYGVQ
jgi:hypothetical protein